MDLGYARADAAGGRRVPALRKDARFTALVARLMRADNVAAVVPLVYRWDSFPHRHRELSRWVPDSG